MKNQLKGNLLLGLETSDSRMSRIAKNEIYHGGDLTPQEVAACIDATTPDEIPFYKAQHRIVLAMNGVIENPIGVTTIVAQDGSVLGEQGRRQQQDEQRQDRHVAEHVRNRSFETHRRGVHAVHSSYFNKE